MPSEEIQILQTPCGIRFGLRGEYSQPAPTLFIFAKALEETLQEKDYFEVGRLLLEHEYLCVSIDLPCHGEDARADEPYGLDGWRTRLERNQNVIADFTAKLTRLLDYLIEQKYSDPESIAVCGTSRGGFVALHFAAADARVRSVAAFAPVVDLTPVPGFAGMETNALMRSLAGENIAPQLVDKAVWVSIGSDDKVVDTDLVIEFTRRIVAAKADENTPANVELHVMPTLGHTTPPNAHWEASRWLLQQ